MQVVHLAALQVLFASLAFLAAASETPTPRLRSPGRPLLGPLEAFSALWHYNEVCYAAQPQSASQLRGYLEDNKSHRLHPWLLGLP